MSLERWVPLLALAWCGCGAGGGEPRETAPATPITYRAYDAEYHGVTYGRIEQTFSGQTTANGFTMRYYVSVALTPGPETFQATLTLDSVPTLTGSALGFPQGEAERARGTAFTGQLTPEGVFRRFGTPDSSLILVRQFQSRLRQLFFPRLPPGGALPGQTWTDTTESSSMSGGLDFTFRTVNRHEAVGWTRHAGERALRIVTVSNYTITGSGTQASAQRITVEGSGERRADEYVGANGTFLGLTAADTARLQAVVAQIGQTIPILQARIDTIRVVR